MNALKESADVQQLSLYAPPPNKGINLTADSVLLTLPLQSGAFNGRLSQR